MDRGAWRAILHGVTKSWTQLSDLQLKTFLLEFIGRTDTEAPIISPPDVKSRLSGKDPDAGNDEGRRRMRPRLRRLAGITDSMDTSLSNLQEKVKDRGACSMASQRVGRV